MKKLCIFLIKVHRFYYYLLGEIIGVVVYSQVDNVQDMIPTADMNPLVLFLLIFGFGYVQVIAMGIFYTDVELKSKDIDPSAGMIKWDNYFPIKINMKMSLFKRLCGYVYVLLRTMFFLASGYFLCAILFLLANK